MLKRRAHAAGLVPELFSGRSLCPGFATTAAQYGVAEHKIMRQCRWTTNKAMRATSKRGSCSWTTRQPSWACRNPRSLQRNCYHYHTTRGSVT